jgi:hypothetical protein
MILTGQGALVSWVDLRGARSITPDTMKVQPAMALTRADRVLAALVTVSASMLSTERCWADDRLKKLECVNVTVFARGPEESGPGLDKQEIRDAFDWGDSLQDATSPRSEC